MMIIGLLECAVGHSALIAFHLGVIYVYKRGDSTSRIDVRFKLDIIGE